jgi:phosphopentomutase
VADLFARRGFTAEMRTASNDESMEALSAALDDVEEGLVLANLVDFDTQWGHRNDVNGFARGLADVDAWLPSFNVRLSEQDVVFITADHGCDPTTPSTDHSREHVPVLAYGRDLEAGVDLGLRQSFADLGATVAEIMGIEGTGAGASFAKEMGFGG